MAAFSSFATSLPMDAGKRKSRCVAVGRLWSSVGAAREKGAGVQSLCIPPARLRVLWSMVRAPEHPGALKRWGCGSCLEKSPVCSGVKPSSEQSRGIPSPEFQASLTSKGSLQNSLERMPLWGIVESKQKPRQQWKYFRN